eukprot:TCONS_00044202-protein
MMDTERSETVTKIMLLSLSRSATTSHRPSFTSLTTQLKPVSSRTSVCPILKVRNPAVSKDFRPVSILHLLPKDLKKIILMQILDHIESGSHRNPVKFKYRRMLYPWKGISRNYRDGTPIMV